MAAEIIYSVFVSSTFDDLREERAEVQKALLRAKCFPIGMELFPSTDEETWEFIKRQIDDCDYYLLVVAGRYGTTTANGISYTEQEYDYAKAIKKPVISFVHTDRSSLELKKSETGDEAIKKLDAFIRKVKTGPIVSAYKSPPELGLHVLAGIMELKERRPARGFVRADEVADFRKYAQLLEENTALKAEIGSLRNARPSILPDLEKVATFKIEQRTKDGALFQETKATWGRVFLTVAKQIVLSAVEDFQISTTLLEMLAGPQLGDRELDWVGDEFGRIKTVLYGWHLIDFDTAHVQEDRLGRLRATTFRYWRLTELGRAQFGLLQDSTLDQPSSAPT